MICTAFTMKQSTTHNVKCLHVVLMDFANQLRSWISKNEHNWEINEKKSVTAKNCVDVKRPNVEVFKDYYPGKNWVSGTDYFGNNNGASRTLYQTTVNKTKPCMMFVGIAPAPQPLQTDTDNFGTQDEVLGGTNPYNN